MAEEEKTYCSMYSRNAELYHHGVKGMKWGVRKDSYYEPVGRPPKQKFFESNKKYFERVDAYNNSQRRKYMEEKEKEEKAEKEKEEMQKKMQDLDHKLQKIEAEHMIMHHKNDKILRDLDDKMFNIELKHEDIFLYGNVPGGKNQKNTYEDDLNMWYKSTSDGRKYKQFEDQYKSRLKIKEEESLKKDTDYQMLLKQKQALKNEMKKKNVSYRDYMDD